MAAETVWHQQALGADINTPSYGSTAPFDGASQAHISEFSASGRQSRISMLAEGRLNGVKIGGYYEMDFLSAGTTSNPNQSNSYTLRQRQFWAQAAFDSGFTVTGGQQWSLITETSHGMDNRTENLPLTIDAQYHTGFSWARQYGFRLTKNFGNKVWLGAAVEEAQATLTVHGNATAQAAATNLCTNAGCTTTTTVNLNPTFNNFLLGAFGTSGGLDNPLGNYAYNLSPDFVVKAVWEPGFGHYEVFGVLASFHDRIFPCIPITGTTPPAGCTSITSAQGATNDARVGGGGGANARWALFAKKVDLGLHFFGGDGIGRYGSAGLPDSTTRPDGTLALLRNYQALGTLQFHPTPKLDIYLNVGGEFTNRAEYTKSGATRTKGTARLGSATRVAGRRPCRSPDPLPARTSEFPAASAARPDSFPVRSEAAQGISAGWSKERRDSGIASTTAPEDEFSSACSIRATFARPSAESVLPQGRVSAPAVSPSRTRTWCSPRSATTCRKKPGAGDSPRHNRSAERAPQNAAPFFISDQSQRRLGIFVASDRFIRTLALFLPPYFLEAPMQPGPR